ncbi:MAG: hypothetical protein ABSC76_05940 [Terracidiphilus sp.]|jgi:hypothetical protein
MLIDEDRLFPDEPGARKLARGLYAHVWRGELIAPFTHGLAKKAYRL